MKAYKVTREMMEDGDGKYPSVIAEFPWQREYQVGEDTMFAEERPGFAFSSLCEAQRFVSVYSDIIWEADVDLVAEHKTPQLIACGIRQRMWEDFWIEQIHLLPYSNRLSIQDQNAYDQHWIGNVVEPPTDTIFCTRIQLVKAVIDESV